MNAQAGSWENWVSEPKKNPKGTYTGPPPTVGSGAPIPSQYYQAQMLNSILNQGNYGSHYAPSHGGEKQNNKQQQQQQQQGGKKGKKNQQGQEQGQSKKQKKQQQQQQTDNWAQDQWPQPDYDEEPESDEAAYRQRVQFALGDGRGASYMMPSKTYALATHGSTAPFDARRAWGGGPRLDAQFVESHEAIAPAKTALYGRTRYARDRIHWRFSPHKDERVSSLLEWIEAVSRELGTFGVRLIFPLIVEYLFERFCSCKSSYELGNVGLCLPTQTSGLLVRPTSPPSNGLDLIKFNTLLIKCYKNQSHSTTPHIKS